MKPATKNDMELIAESANAIVAGTIAKSILPEPEQQINENVQKHAYTYEYTINLTDDEFESSKGDSKFIMEQISKHFTGKDYLGEGQLKYKTREGF